MPAKDHAGVLGQVAQILSSQSISIEALIQKEPAAGSTEVPVVILTNRTDEGAMQRAIEQIESFEGIVDKISMIRVESAN